MPVFLFSRRFPVAEVVVGVGIIIVVLIVLKKFPGQQ